MPVGNLLWGIFQKLLKQVLTMVRGGHWMCRMTGALNWTMTGIAPGGGNIGFFPTGTGWYRKHFDVPKFNPENKYSIEFDGVHMNSEVWVNGIYLGKYPYGYSSFSYDLSGLLKSKDNIIAVRVDNSKQPNSRWYTGSGIYRHVRLVETGKLHLKNGACFTIPNPLKTKVQFFTLRHR
jgi:hypothetical protein